MEIRTVQELIDALERYKAKYGNTPVSIGCLADPWTYHSSSDYYANGSVIIVQKEKECHITDFFGVLDDGGGWKTDFEGFNVTPEED